MATNLPALSTANARLPQTYETAKVALSECERVDECKDWADKAQALASYARQSDDQTLEKLAMRIRTRAMKRAGELLKQFQTSPGGGRPKENGGSAHPVSQRSAARVAGMSKDQEKTAVRIANVPDEEFEAAVESESPPTLTALAEKGKQARPQPERPAGFAEATHATAAMRRFAEQCERHAPEFIAGGLMPTEHAEARALVERIDGWLDRFIVNQKG